MCYICKHIILYVHVGLSLSPEGLSLSPVELSLSPVGLSLSPEGYPLVHIYTMLCPQHVHMHTMQTLYLYTRALVGKTTAKQ